MPNDKQALDLFKTYMVLGPDYQHGKRPTPLLPKPIAHLIMQFAQYDDWIKTANDLAALLEKNELNFITQSEAWAQDHSLTDAKKWLRNPDEPLITESYEFYQQSIMPLIKFIASSPLVDEFGWTALMWAARYNHAEALKAMLAVPGTDANRMNPYGWTALMMAACFGHTEALETLLAVPGINVNAVNGMGWTALTYLGYNGHTEALKILLAVPGIEVNSVDHIRRTASMYAAVNNHTEAVRLINEHLSQQERGNQNKCTIL